MLFPTIWNKTERENVTLPSIKNNNQLTKSSSSPAKEIFIQNTHTLILVIKFLIDSSDF